MNKRYIFLFIFCLCIFVFVPGTTSAEKNITDVQITDASITDNNKIYVEYKLTGTPPQNYTGSISPLNINGGTTTGIGTPICGQLTKESERYSHLIPSSDSYDSYMILISVDKKSDSVAVTKSDTPDVNISEDTKRGFSEDCNSKYREESYDNANKNVDNDSNSEVETNDKSSGNSVFLVLIIFWFLVLLLVLLIVK